MSKELAGCFAISLAGHDKGTVYIIVDIDGEYAFLSDGRIRGLENPKKKKLRHIQVIKRKDETIQLKSNAGWKIINEDIKHAIKVYIGG
ncbi:MAG: KOW domain-containing RNA-binding protein [Eubacteriales bacterium]|nr:KOW domain-containing RNA-binding protein [Eubacteriales bacterium]